MTPNKVGVSSKDLAHIHIEHPELVFTTYDLGLSAALLSVGFELLSVDKENPKKALFVFKKRKGIDDIANQYFSDQLQIKARSFFDHLKALKNKLYSQ